MDTSEAAAKTDKLGRRSGPRRKYTLAEKRAMVEETRLRGASVSEVAQRHGVNTNLLFGWRRLYHRGALSEESQPEPPALLPVQVTTPTLTPGQAQSRKPPATGQLEQGSMEIEFPGGQRVRIHGRVDPATLRRVIGALLRR